MIIDNIIKELLDLEVSYIDLERENKIRDILNKTLSISSNKVETFISEVNDETWILVLTPICFYKITIDKDEINPITLALKTFQHIETIKFEEDKLIGSQFFFDHYTFGLVYENDDEDILIFLKRIEEARKTLSNKI